MFVNRGRGIAERSEISLKTSASVPSEFGVSRGVFKGLALRQWRLASKLIVEQMNELSTRRWQITYLRGLHASFLFNSSIVSLQIKNEVFKTIREGGPSRQFNASAIMQKRWGQGKFRLQVCVGESFGCELTDDSSFRSSKSDEPMAQTSLALLW